MSRMAQARTFPDLEWLSRNADVIAERSFEHLWLTVAAVVIGFAIAFPLGLLSRQYPGLRRPLVNLTGVLFTIPSLAAFVALVPFFGLSTTTSLIPLVAYTLLILLRNIVTGLDGVPAEVVESAEAMGYRPPQLLRGVELPLALPVIIAGVRVASVTTIGLVTVTAVVGRGGLGQIILVGFRRDNTTATVVGFALSIALAVLIDLLLIRLERRLTPWSRAVVA